MMATFFGEVLPVFSRAVVDDEDEDVPVPEVFIVRETAEETTHDHPNFDCQLLVVAVGPSASTFVEAYILSRPLLPVASVQVRGSDKDDTDDQLSGLKFRKQPTTLGHFYHTHLLDKVLCCVVPEKLLPEQSTTLGEKIFSCVNRTCFTKPVVIILTSLHMCEYKTQKNFDEHQSIVLRALHSSTYTTGRLNQPYLEQPNTLSGLAAAVLSECEVREIPGVLFICYTDMLDSDPSHVQAFVPLLEQHPFKSFVIPNEEAEANLKNLLMQRTRDWGNLYM